MTKVDLEQAKQAEAEFFDDLANFRTQNQNIIAQEVDIRRATKYIPKKNEKATFLIDSKMSDKLAGGARDRYIKELSSKPGARILDIGCGSGWLALEMARHGCHVDAYDLSPKAIALAKKTLKENPYKEGFGSVTYYLQDVSVIDLGIEKYDAVSGWSSFPQKPFFYMGAILPGTLLNFLYLVYFNVMRFHYKDWKMHVFDLKSSKYYF